MMVIKYFVAAACAFVCCVHHHGLAQQASPAIRTLSIGDTIPEALWNTAVHVIETGQGSAVKSSTLQSLRAELTILDFWASWCGPCLDMFERTAPIKAQYKDAVRFVPITHENRLHTAKFLDRFMQQRHIAIETIVEDSTLSAYFVHAYLPHYVWIGKAGNVIAITGYEAINQKNIADVLAGKPMADPTKIDEMTEYDNQKPLFINGNGGQADPFMQYSVLTGYKPGLPAGYSFGKVTYEGKEYIKISCRNEMISNLFKLAYGQGRKFFGHAVVKYETADSAKIRFFNSGPNPLFTKADLPAWSQQNLYCYELMLPIDMSREQAFSIMQDDLHRNFLQYRVSIEHVHTNALALVKIAESEKLLPDSDSKPFKHEGEDGIGANLINYDFATFFVWINYKYSQQSELPVVNETGLKNVNLKLEGNLFNLEELNKELAAYGLQFVEKMSDVEMIVFRDSE